MMQVPEGEVLDLFRRTGAFLEGHFQLSSGLHSPKYLQCALVLQHPQHAERLGRALAGRLAAAAEVVVSPAMGGLIIGHEVARALGVRHIFAERDAARRMTLRRGFQVRRGERAVIVEDVITTGGSSLEVADLGVPRVALATLEVETWRPEQCPMCGRGLPLDKPGSRAL